MVHFSTHQLSRIEEQLFNMDWSLKYVKLDLELIGRLIMVGIGGLSVQLAILIFILARHL